MESVSESSVSESSVSESSVSESSSSVSSSSVSSSSLSSSSNEENEAELNESVREKNYKIRYTYLGLMLVTVICLGLVMLSVFINFSKLVGAVRDVLTSSRAIVYGLVIGYFLTPFLNFFENKLIVPVFKKLKLDTVKYSSVVRTFSVVVTLGVVGLFIYAIIIAVVPQIAVSIASIYEQLPRYAASLTELIGNYSASNKFLQDAGYDLVEILTDELGKLYLNYLNIDKITELLNSTFVQSAVQNVAGFLGRCWNLIIGVVIAIYVFYSKESFCRIAVRTVYAFLGEKKGKWIIDDCRFINRTFVGFVSGKLVDSTIIGIITLISTYILGMPYPVLVSVIIGVTNMIPFFGPFLGGIPCVLLIFVVDPMDALIFAIFVLVLQQVDGNLIGPKILGDSTGIKGFWVIFSITLFGGMWGIPGMFLGVPIFACIYAFFRRTVTRLLLARGYGKNLENIKTGNKPEGDASGENNGEDNTGENDDNTSYVFNFLRYVDDIIKGKL